MAKIIVTHAERAPAHFHIDAERTLIGRGEHCQIRLEGDVVSKEHAVILSVGNDDILEDLGSTNGTRINAQPLHGRHVLQNKDEFAIAGYTLQYISQRAQKYMDADKTMMFAGTPVELGEGEPHAAILTKGRHTRAARPRGGLRGLSGRNAGKTIELDRVIRRIGQPGFHSAAILLRPHGYYLMHVEGSASTKLNGSSIGQEWRPLSPNDVIEVAGETYSFHLAQD